MIVTAKCDVCGIVLNAEEIETDCDGQHFCRLHYLENRLWYLQREYREKEEWIEKVYYKPQRELKIKIEDLESEIKKYKTEHNSR